MPSGPLLGLLISFSLHSLPCCLDFSDEGYHGKSGEGGSIFQKARKRRKEGVLTHTPLPPLPMCRVPCAGCCLSGSWVLVPLSQAGGSPQPLSPSLPPVRVVFVLPLPWPGCSHSLLFLSGVLSSLVPALSVRGLSSVSVFLAFVGSFFSSILFSSLFGFIYLF